MPIEERIAILRRVQENDKNHLIESLKKKAAQDGREFSCGIQDYGITDQEANIEIGNKVLWVMMMPLREL